MTTAETCGTGEVEVVMVVVEEFKGRSVELVDADGGVAAAMHIDRGHHIHHRLNLVVRSLELCTVTPSNAP